VVPPVEDIELLRHLSQKILNPPVVVTNENNSVIRENEVTLNMNESFVPLDAKKLKARKLKRDDNDDMSLKTEVCKKSVLYDDDGESDEKKRKFNVKRKRVEDIIKPKRILVDFGICAPPPYKARKVLTSKASSKSSLSNSKVLTKHLAESIPKPPIPLPVAFMAISKAYSEIIEGDHFEDINKTVFTYVPDVFKCPDGYMSSQIYKEVIKVPG
jgi:hypothetical protein